ncbi:MAG: AAA family ATPase [Deltaproteobacteria bacterium]|jgi:hypothetical protein|nr:AAA family ATPase [Deltaproteobacteria bacterium]
MPTLPDGGQPFPKIREAGLLYADKTEFVRKIVQAHGCVFLSRPRRFGKSLLLGAMAEALKGRRELFEGLRLGSSGYGFKPYPVVRLTMTGRSRDEAQPTSTFADKVKGAAMDNGVAEADVEVIGCDPGDMLLKPVTILNGRFGERAAVLIDEHYAPINEHYAPINEHGAPINEHDAPINQALGDAGRA